MSEIERINHELELVKSIKEDLKVNDEEKKELVRSIIKQELFFLNMTSKSIYTNHQLLGDNNINEADWLKIKLERLNNLNDNLNTKLNSDNLDLLKNLIIDYENELYYRLISINVNSEHIQR